MIPAVSIATDLARGRLVRVLAEYEGPGGSLYMVCPQSRFVPQAVALLREYLYVQLRALLHEGPEKTARA